MSKPVIEAPIARKRMFLLVFWAMVASFTVLTVLAMGMSEANWTAAAQQLLAIYVPLLALMGVFYSSEWNSRVEPPPTPSERFWPLFIMTATWVALPTALMLVVVLLQDGSIEQAMRMLSVFAFLGQSIGVVGVALYFAKPRSADNGTERPGEVYS